MRVSTVNMKATIPTGQYANVVAEFAVELDETDSVEAAKALALDQIESVSAMYAQSDAKALKRSKTNPFAGEAAMELSDFITGETLKFYHGAHAYMDDEGIEYVSGSKFAHQYTHEFDKANILPRYAAKHDVDEEVVDEMWSDKGEASTTFGTAVHKALEVFGKNYNLHIKLGKDPYDCIHPSLRSIVKSFYTAARIKDVVAGKMIWEAFVVDKTLKRCGQLDLVTIVDKKKKILDIEDYKTNVDIYKVNQPNSLLPPYKALPNMPVSAYTLQLSFYKDIVEANGWTVRKIKLHHLQGDHWDEVDLSPVNTVRTRVKTELI